jgi:23S rRNA maturation mini-RNase III
MIAVLATLTDSELFGLLENFSKRIKNSATGSEARETAVATYAEISNTLNARMGRAA